MSTQLKLFSKNTFNNAFVFFKQVCVVPMSLLCLPSFHNFRETRSWGIRQSEAQSLLRITLSRMSGFYRQLSGQNL